MFDPKKDSFTIEDRAQLIYALTEAAALEHLLMCQYIFAAASLKTHISELGDSERRYHQLERIRYWKRKLYEVAREEMQHLAIAMNLLIAVGGAPTFARPNFPAANQYYKTKGADGEVHALTMSLERFSGTDDDPFRTIDRFIRFELPASAARLLGVGDAAIPPPNVYDTVGALYAAIAKAFGEIPDVIVDVNDQYSPTDEDARPVRLSGRPPVNAIAKTPDDAKNLIQQIVYQGEGYPDTRDDPRAHYRIFRGIKDDYAHERAMDRDFQPARSCAPNPRLRTDELSDLSNVTLIDPATDGGLQFELLQLFAGAYEVLIGFLNQLFGPIPQGGTPPAFRAIETLTFLPYMSEIIAPLAEVLTQVPVKLGRPSAGMLGPSFEVTSNDFLIPSLEVGTQLALERIKTLAANASAVADKLENAHLNDQATQISFVAKTFEILASELRSRVDFGWPPAQSQWDMKYSEIAPSSTDFAQTFKSYPLLEIYLEGIVQCRLATDPDGAAVRRGVVGNGFAIGDEADLDRIIYFSPAGAFPRSRCPPLGVRVRSARLIRRSVGTGREPGELVPELLDASVALVLGPKFEGRNHVVSEDGEPIDPFVFAIDAPGGIHLRRSTLGIAVNDMTPLQRRGTGRYPQSVSVSGDAMKRNLSIINRVSGTAFSDPLNYTLTRIDELTRDFNALKGSPKEFGREGAELQFRLRSLDEGLRPPQVLDARGIRWLRFFFDAAYRHYISGDSPKAEFGPLASRYALLASGGDAARWVIDYHLGFFDTDAMSACFYGTLWLPVVLTN